jgi:adenosine deaminase
LEKITMNSIKSAFIHFKERCHLIYDVIKPGYARLRS